MTSPPGVPLTATSDATIPYTLASEVSHNHAEHTAGEGSVKGKGVAYPRPSVTPAEYTQQQRQLGAPSSSGGGLGVQRDEGKGPLKVVNTTPRPESIAAFQKQSMGGGSAIGGVGGKKVTGFTVGNTGSISNERSKAEEAAIKGSAVNGKDQIPENSKWNVLRSTLRRGMSFGEKSSASISPAVTVDAQSASLVDEHKGRTVDRDSLEQLQDQLTGTSTEKLQFFERYKRMADENAVKPGVMARSLSNRSAASPVVESFGGQREEGSARKSQDVKVRAELLGSLVEEAKGIKSPIMTRLEEAYLDDNNTAGFRSRRNDSDRPTPRSSVVETAGRKPPLGPRRPSESRSHGKRIPESGSISSIDSAQAEKMRMGEVDLLTPSTSMDRLAEVTLDSKKGEPFRHKAFSWDREQDTVEGLIDKPIETAALDLEFDQMFSPNLSQATSGQSSRFRRESAASSLLAPSDSISTPGVNDKHHIDYTALAAAQARLTPGSKACQKCGQSFKGKRYIERDGMLLCEPDWKEMFLPKVS